MIDLVSDHGDYVTNPTAEQTPRLDTAAPNFTVDTGLQSAAVASRALPLPDNSQEATISMTQPPTAAPLTREDTQGSATDPRAFGVTSPPLHLEDYLWSARPAIAACACMHMPAHATII